MNTLQSNSDSEPVQITLTLRPLPSAVPVFIRLRRVLKGLLRTYSFECVDYGMTPTPPIQSGHSGPIATPTLSDANPPTANGTPEGGSCNSVAATPVVDAMGGMPDGQNVDRLCLQGVNLGKCEGTPPAPAGPAGD